ncbi:MAG: GAF domain-containing protein [Planctomycetota bacterium]
MPPAPIPEREADRLEALLCCNILDTDTEPEFDDIAALAVRLTGRPMAIVSLMDKDRQWFKSSVGFGVSETPRDQAFCGYVVYSNEPLIVENALADPRFADNPLVTGEPHLRSYAGVPLIMPNGTSVGTLCVLDTKPGACSRTMFDDLVALGRQATSQLHLRYRLGELDAANRRIMRESETKTRFLANVSHEIRTPMTAILGYTDLLDASTEAGREILNDPDWLQHAVDSIRVNAGHLMTVIDDIHDGAKIDAGQLELRPCVVDLPALLGEVCELHETFAARKGIVF